MSQPCRVSRTAGSLVGHQVHVPTCRDVDGDVKLHGSPHQEIFTGKWEASPASIVDLGDIKDIETVNSIVFDVNIPSSILNADERPKEHRNSREQRARSEFLRQGPRESCRIGPSSYAKDQKRGFDRSTGTSTEALGDSAVWLWLGCRNRMEHWREMADALDQSLALCRGHTYHHTTPTSMIPRAEQTEQAAVFHQQHRAESTPLNTGNHGRQCACG